MDCRLADAVWGNDALATFRVHFAIQRQDQTVYAFVLEDRVEFRALRRQLAVVPSRYTSEICQKPTFSRFDN